MIPSDTIFIASTSNPESVSSNIASFGFNVNNQKIYGSNPIMCKPSKHLQEYLENQNIDVSDIVNKLPEEMPIRTQEEGFVQEEVAENNLVSSPDDALNKNEAIDANAVEVKAEEKVEEKTETTPLVAEPTVIPAAAPAPPVDPVVQTPPPQVAVPVIEQSAPTPAPQQPVQQPQVVAQQVPAQPQAAAPQPAAPQPTVQAVPQVPKLANE